MQIRSVNAEIVIQKRGFLFRPLSIVLAIGGIVILWSLMRGNLATLVLLAVAVLFLLGLKRPLWAIVSLLVSQMTVTSYMVSTPLGEVSLRLLLLMLTVLVMAPAFVQRQVDLGPGARRLLIPLLVLIGISTIANLVNSGFDFALKDFRNMIVGLLIVILLPAVVRSPRDLKVLCGVSLLVITASAVIGVMQHYQFLGMDQATLRSGFLTTGEPRVPGMGESYLELSYILSITVLVILSVFLTKGTDAGNRKLLLLSLLPMVGALYFTYTRSALYALGLGVLALVLFLRTRVRGEMVIGVVLVAVFVIETTGILNTLQIGGRSATNQEESALSRPILWQAGIAIALDNPILGIGGDQFSRISPQYAGAVDPSLLQWEEERYWSYQTLGNEPPHNDFLNMWISYGTLALLAYVWLYFVIMRNLFDAYVKSKKRFLKGLSIGLGAGLVAYAGNAFYHNLMITLPLLWILAGLSLATCKLASGEVGGPKLSAAVGR